MVLDRYELVGRRYIGWTPPNYMDELSLHVVCCLYHSRCVPIARGSVHERLFMQLLARNVYRCIITSVSVSQNG